MKRLFIFIGLMFATVCINVQANAHSVLINGPLANSGNERVQLD
jgi:hypothetical protein